ncbi:hypothetical protein FRC02_009127 [Tulasnella sp. 418]|nr:hypothetical protein FRC02_009127 [Tulasnella sp. 418]
MVGSRSAVIPPAGTFARRSPRNHPPPTSSSSRPNLNVKPAFIPWDEDPELLASLLSAMEANSRWRMGNFNPCTPQNRYQKAQFARHRDLCCEEIARALLLRHPTYQHSYRSRPHAYARAFRDKLDALTGNSDDRCNNQENELFNYSAAAWRNRRQRHVCMFPGKQLDNLSWNPLLPPELQLLIVKLAIHDTSDGSLIHRVALSLSMVNSTWKSWVEPHLYTDVTIKSMVQHETLLGPAGKLYHIAGYLQTLRIHWIPDRVYFQGGTRLRVHEFHHDMSNARQELAKKLEPPASDSYASRIQHYASLCIPLYQLIVDVEAETLRLTWDDSMEVAERQHRLFWRDLLGAHLASLKLMTRCRHLIISGGAYLQLLPSAVTFWCHAENWQVVLEVLRGQNITSATDGMMPSMLDESTVSKLTLQHRQVPTLSILAEMAQGTQVKVIELMGWDVDDEEMPSDWRAFLETEKTRKQDGRGSLVKWIRSSGLAL